MLFNGTYVRARLDLEPPRGVVFLRSLMLQKITLNIFQFQTRSFSSWKLLFFPLFLCCFVRRFWSNWLRKQFQFHLTASKSKRPETSRQLLLEIQRSPGSACCQQRTKLQFRNLIAISPKKNVHKVASSSDNSFVAANANVSNIWRPEA